MFFATLVGLHLNSPSSRSTLFVFYSYSGSIRADDLSAVLLTALSGAKAVNILFQMWLEATDRLWDASINEAEFVESSAALEAQIGWQAPLLQDRTLTLRTLHAHPESLPSPVHTKAVRPALTLVCLIDSTFGLARCHLCKNLVWCVCVMSP